MDPNLKREILANLASLLILARQSVPFGHQKTDPVLTRAQALMDRIQATPEDKTKDPNVVTFNTNPVTGS